MIYGYARVSTKGQDLYGNGLESQEKVLRENGAVEIFRDSFTGTKRHRPALDKLLSVVKEGDTIIVAKLDRIARSTKDGIDIIDDLLGRGVSINVLNMGKFDNTPTGRLIRTIFLAFAEFERDMIVQRTSEGKEIARMKEGYREGRKIKCTKERFIEVYNDMIEGEYDRSTACSLLGITTATWYRNVDRWIKQNEF